MANQTKTSKYGVKDDDSHAPSNNLWVGNLSIEVTDRDLMDLFSRYGPVDSLTSYSSRSYAFVLFKSVEDAKTAKDALQGAPLRGCSLKIYFAKPAKPCRQLWVGGVSPSVTKEELEVEFIKFGKVDEYKFYKERNAAYFEYANLEDASQALKSMSGKRIGGEQIRVDFYRSLSAKREQGPGFQDHEEGRSTGVSDTPFNPHVAGKNFSEPAHAGHKRQPPATGRKGDGQPSTVLWVGYPPSLRVDEQMLHNAMILFGEIEGIKVFPERHYAFVEFRSVDEARRAKEGLQGRLFKDSRVTIMFSCSSLAPGKGSRPPQVDTFGNNRPGVPNNFSGAGILGAPVRPFGPHASYEPLLPGSFNDSGAFYKQDSNPNIAIGRRQPPSGPGMHNSPGSSPSITRPASSGWDGFDDSHYQRDPKRSRLDVALPFNGASRLVKNFDERGTGMRHEYGAGMENDDDKESVAGVRPIGRGHSLGSNDKDFIWRGTIAKGGTLVCHARCLAVGKGIGSDLPAVVNCCARTGLDMLTKHYAEAIGFEIVYFLPDSENDFASYTEFLRYLGSKDRAGVAKLEDGTTLFLVPPSDFLTNVLNVTGPDRLYGVVLRLPLQSPDGSARHQQHLSQHPPLPLPQNIDGRYTPEYGLDQPLKVGGVAHVDRNRILEGSEFPSKVRLPHTSEPYMAQSAPQDYTSGNSAGTSQAKLTLTPELIATLASILPSKSSGLDSSQPVSATNPDPHDSRMLSHGWKTENQYHEQIDHLLDPQAHHLTQFQSYHTIPNHPAHHSPQLGYDSSQFQDFGSKTNYGSNNNYGFASQSAVPPVSQQVSNPRYEGQVLSQHPQAEYGTVIPGRDANRFYGSTEFQAQHYSNNNNPVNFSRPQDIMMRSAVERASSELPKPVQPVQAILSGGGQSSSEGSDVDKNQRYQSTLQFAANLLLQIQQQQQQQQQQQLGNQQ